MASFDAVNYSLRPNKTIQRGIVFDGLKTLSVVMPWRDAAYIGFGSIWFTDFVLAHKRLGLNRMVSIEANEIGFRRALYNKPYRFVRVLEGLSYDVVPTLYDDPEIANLPWIVWLDYDTALSEDSIFELRDLVERAPSDSLLLVTVDAAHKRYGKDSGERAERLRNLLGDIVPDRPEPGALKDTDPFADTLSTYLEQFLVSAAESCARPGGLVPAFRLPYRDKAAMATVGVVLPSPERRQACLDVVSHPNWMGVADRPIIAPHLTMRELAVLQAQLPAAPMDRAAVRALGFDLGEDQIGIFQRYYKYYPTFAQIGT